MGNGKVYIHLNCFSEPSTMTGSGLKVPDGGWWVCKPIIVFSCKP